MSGHPPILISACLLGQPVRFDGQGKPRHHEVLERWRSLGCLVPLCPEVAGGLGVPRPPAEIQPGASAMDVLQGRAQVKTQSGQDVSDAFRRGAMEAGRLARQLGIQVAVLKARSPSCGHDEVYDGHFHGRLTAGHGLTAAHLIGLGVRVFHEGELDAAWQAWRGLGQPGWADDGASAG